MIPVWFGLEIGYKMDRQQITTIDKWLGKVCKIKGEDEKDKRWIMTMIPMTC